MTQMSSITALGRGSLSMVERNLTFLFSGSSYGWAVFASAVESLLLLGAFAWGFGDVDVTLADGTASFAEFVAPALVAVAALNAAWAENLFTFFGKLTFAKLYRPILYTPMSSTTIAIGELLTGLLRVGLQVALVTSTMWVFGLAPGSSIVGLLAAGLAIGAAFSIVGMALGTFLRTWEDFDFVNALQVALMVVSGVFFPISTLPSWLHVVAEVSPLHYAVGIVRSIRQGAVPPLSMVVGLSSWTVGAGLVLCSRVRRVMSRC